MGHRQQQALEVRRIAAEMAAARPHPRHPSNGDELRYRRTDGRPSYVASFTKCLPHDADGFVTDPLDYADWVRSIDSGDVRDIAALRIGPPGQDPAAPVWSGPQAVSLTGTGTAVPVRGWESQGAGLTFDLQGPDAQSLAMPPAPSLDSQELIAEMGEIYWMALARDVPFAGWDTDATIAAARKSLKRLWWFRADRTANLTGITDRLPTSLERRRILSPDGKQSIPIGKLFRGDSFGVQAGPYLSQFLLIGNRGVGNAQMITDGQIAFGAIRVDQRVRVATVGQDYLQNWQDLLDVQNGADVRRSESYQAGYRFIATPRDLATYVHYDALYEAYLNACLILLGLGAPRDPGMPFLAPDHVDKQAGFAQFGDPHILTLLTEVATRALKAVRFQKFNIHRRLRPEALGGWMYQRRNGPSAVKTQLAALEPMEDAFAGSSGIGLALDAFNGGTGNWLLPMAFPEGSPSHPSYGAGHATVAGACVTVLKAWFDHGWGLRDNGAIIGYLPTVDGTALVDAGLAEPLTVEGELNKVAANIAIGRNWAGVHYYSDYLESFRLGEQVAIGILEEQKLTYGENFSMTVPLIDGTTIRI